MRISVEMILFVLFVLGFCFYKGCTAIVEEYSYGCLSPGVDVRVV